MSRLPKPESSRRTRETDEKEKQSRKVNFTKSTDYLAKAREDVALDAENDRRKTIVNMHKNRVKINKKH